MDVSKDVDFVGRSVVSPDHVFGRLSPTCHHISMEELNVIRKALEFIFCCPTKTFLVLTDSLSSLQKLQSLFSVHSLVQGVCQSLTSITNQGKIIVFLCFPGSADFTGKEEADAHAYQVPSWWPSRPSMVCARSVGWRQPPISYAL